MVFIPKTSAKLTIVDAPRLQLILETFSYFDEIRWQDAANYNPLNYSHDDLSADEKLLTHWLCYITDRQTPFQRVWDVGGYVISDLVRTYTRNPKVNLRVILDAKPYLECDLQKPNQRLNRYGILGPRIRFTPRYAPEDIYLIYRTLRILEIVAQRSFAQYVTNAIAKSIDKAIAIRMLAVALNELTYTAGSTVSAVKLQSAFDKTDIEAEKFQQNENVDVPLFGRKRLWCSLRDYLKSPDFNKEFVEAISRVGASNPEGWSKNHPDLTKSLAVLELPGDVWNNAPVFRKGVFSPYLRNEPKSWDMPRTIRRIYDLLIETHPIQFYPEQLDVTFDFVPRMCERQACNVCPFGAGIDQVCHARKGYFCSVALVCCGYSHKCDPEQCFLKKNRVRGFCHQVLQ